MEPYRVRPGDVIDLAQCDPDALHGVDGESAAERETKELNKRLEGLQELLYAEAKHKVLIVLQAMDTAGKDSTIRHVFEGVNPQGVRVASFKKPTLEELSHDYLWRVHEHTPAAGQMVIFNRSHYEDVLVVRVHNLVAQAVWSKRYAHINDFERMLADEGTTILKFFLHISPDEQRERLQDRLDQPDKQWKFAKADLAERKLWPEYMTAYAEMLSKTSTAWAPWFIVPANRKWVRNWVISHVIVDTLESLNMSYPAVEEGLDQITIE